MRRRQLYFKQPLRIRLGKGVSPADGGPHIGIWAQQLAEANGHASAWGGRNRLTGRPFNLGFTCLF